MRALDGIFQTEQAPCWDGFDPLAPTPDHFASIKRLYASPFGSVRIDESDLSAGQSDLLTNKLVARLNH